jgi:hypothetical protein
VVKIVHALEPRLCEKDMYADDANVFATEA